jgi:hypothetical protein
MDTPDKMEMGRFFACGGLVHLERESAAARSLLNAIADPPKRSKHKDTRSVEQHLDAIESIVADVRVLLRDGWEKPMRIEPGAVLAVIAAEGA